MSSLRKVITEMYLKTPAVLKLKINEDISQGNVPDWMHWSWCDMDDLLDLINEEFSLEWEIKDLLERFAIDKRKLNESHQSLALSFLVCGSPGLNVPNHFRLNDYSREAFLIYEHAVVTYYVPFVWTKNVIFAMRQGCMSFSVVGPEGAESQKVIAVAHDENAESYDLTSEKILQ